MDGYMFLFRRPLRMDVASLVLITRRPGLLTCGSCASSRRRQNQGHMQRVALASTSDTTHVILQLLLLWLCRVAVKIIASSPSCVPQ